MKKYMFNNMEEIVKFYGQVKCYFINFDGPEAIVEFGVTTKDGTEIHISVGGCAGYLKDLVFGPEGLTVYALSHKHIARITITDKNGTTLYHASFEALSS